MILKQSKNCSTNLKRRRTFFIKYFIMKCFRWKRNQILNVKEILKWKTNRRILSFHTICEWKRFENKKSRSHFIQLRDRMKFNDFNQLQFRLNNFYNGCLSPSFKFTVKVFKLPNYVLCHGTQKHTKLGKKWNRANNHDNNAMNPITLQAKCSQKPYGCSPIPSKSGKGKKKPFQ